MSLISPRSRLDWAHSGFIIVIFIGLIYPMVLQIAVLVILDKMMSPGQDIAVPIIIVTFISVSAVLGTCLGLMRIERGIG